jgi:hypothetical protein
MNVTKAEQDEQYMLEAIKIIFHKQRRQTTATPA